MTTDRAKRLFNQTYPVDDKKEGSMWWKDGELREGITLDGQKITFDFKRVYADDAIALIRDIYSMYNERYPSNNNASIIHHLNQAIYEADRRAVSKHGYSYNEEEANLKTPY